MHIQLILFLVTSLAFSCRQEAPQTTTLTDLKAATTAPLSADTLAPESVIESAQVPLLRYDYDTTQWAEIIAMDSTIRLDIRYATDNNFMQTTIYDCGRCFYRKNVAEALVKVHRELSTQGLGLKMYDCYRPAPYQQRLWDVMPDARYVARPEKGSVHGRGAAADLTIVHLETGEELDMGTPYDFFGEAAYTTTTNLPKEVLDNRALFQAAMRKHGFGTIRTEWWHFNFKGPRFELADWTWDCE